EIWRGYDVEGYRDGANILEIFVPVKHRNRALKLLQGALVVFLSRIPPTYVVHGSLGQRCFDLDDRSCFAGREARRIPTANEHVLDVCKILAARLHEISRAVKIVPDRVQRHATLVDLGYHFSCIA